MEKKIITPTGKILKHQWYIIQCISNHEDKVKQALENKRASEDLGEIISEVFLPKIIKEAKSGSKKKRPIFPGYIFVKMVMTDEAWYIVRNTQDVTGIVGSSGQRTKPTPITQHSINKMIMKMENSQEEETKEAIAAKSNVEIQLVVGDDVMVMEGPWEGSVSSVKEVDNKAKTVIVEIEVFGKLINTTTPFSFLKKLGK